ncbi:MAG TPA: hypothetical protein VFP58_12465 [Candidatus Eisenbacteria bacterium]|nr:hypothetical protein [Candidatus Eisenbacteria bacterium]
MTFRFTERAIRGWILAAALVLIPSVTRGQTQTHYITLEWTAPGDDGNVGQASQYEMRYSTTDPANATDTLSWWNSATQVPGLPYPSYSGGTDQVTLQGLTANVTYYFVLRTRDEVPTNWSGFSNVAFGQPNTCIIPNQTPQSFTVVNDSDEALLTWSGVPDASAQALEVWRGTGLTGALSRVASLPASDTTFRDDPGYGTYRYQVRWVSGCGNGPASPTVPITFTAPTQPTGPQAGVQARPNPSSGPVSFVVTVPGSGSTTVILRLYDSTGRMTAVVADAAYPPGEHTVLWPRTSSSGDRVAPGYYELIGKIGTTRVRERLVLLP